MSKTSSIASAHGGLRNNVAPDYWWNDRGLRRLNGWLAVLQLGDVVVGYDGSLMNGFWAIDDFLHDMGHPDANMQGLISAAVPIGFCLAFLPAAWWGDRRGRREPQVAACALIAAASFAQTFLYSAWRLFACRVVIGIGCGVLCTLGPAHILELAHPRQAVQQAALFGSNWFVGYILASWLTFGCLYLDKGNWNWRLPSLVQGVPSVVQGVLLFWVPESPRWLYSVGRGAEGHAVLAKYHANGDMEDELVLHQVAEIKAALGVAASAKQVSYLDFFRTKANRKRLFLAVYVGALVQWAGNGLISYYLVDVLEAVGIGNSVQQAGVNGGIAIWSYAVAIFASLFAQRIGRRRLWLCSLSGMLASYVLITLLNAVFARTASAAAGSASVVFLFSHNAAYALAGTALAYVYVLELLPFAMRTKGLAISNVADQVAAVSGTYFSPVAFEAITYYYYIVYIGVLAVSLVVAYLCFPETANLSLEESAQLLDDAAVMGQFERAAERERVLMRTEAKA